VASIKALTGNSAFFYKGYRHSSFRHSINRLILHSNVQTRYGAHPAFCLKGTGVFFFREFKRPGRVVYCSPLSRAELENEYSYEYYLITLYSSVVCTGTTLSPNAQLLTKETINYVEHSPSR